MTPKKIIPLLALMISINNLPASAEIILIPGDYPTIQEGIDAANEYDTVLVKPGEYVENIDFIGKNIVVASLFLTSGNPEFITTTIIDGGSSGPVVRIAGVDSTAIVIGFTIQNGYSYNGAGVRCILGADAKISNNIIRWNESYGSDNFGGGIYCYNSNPIIRDNLITENTACWGGGIGLDYSDPVIGNNIIRGNLANP